MLIWAQSIYIPIVDEYYLIDKVSYMKYTCMPSHMSNEFFHMGICLSNNTTCSNLKILEFKSVEALLPSKSPLFSS